MLHLMIWQDWLLIYIAGGVLFIGIRMAGEGDGRDARDLFFTLLIYPVFPFTYIWYRYNKNKDEKKRQARVAKMVSDGKYTKEDAIRIFHWNGKPAK